jgi:hypothetical protein
MSQGQTVALLMASAGLALLVLALALQGQSRLESVRTRTRSVLVGALLLTAGLALLLVRRLDPAALSRVLANVMAAVVAAAVAGRERRWPTTSGPLNSLRGHRVAVLRANRSPNDLSKDLS